MTFLWRSFLCFAEGFLRSIFLTRWRNLLLGLMFGLMMSAPISHKAFWNSDWGLHSVGITFSVNCCFIQKCFQNVIWQSLKDLFLSSVLHIAPWPWEMTTKTFTISSPEPPFFSFFCCGAFQYQTLWLFMLCHCDSWSSSLTWISVESRRDFIKINPSTICPKVLGNKYV